MRVYAAASLASTIDRMTADVLQRDALDTEGILGQYDLGALQHGAANTNTEKLMLMTSC